MGVFYYTEKGMCIAMVRLSSVAGWISLTSIIMCDLLGEEKLALSFGVLNGMRGFATFIGPPLAGKNIYHITRGVHPSKSMMHDEYSSYFDKIYKFPLFPQNL